MMNSKQINRKKGAVVKSTNLPATLRKIPHGTTVRYSRRELGSESSVRSAVWRENARGAAPEYTIELVDSGLYYDITRR